MLLSRLLPWLFAVWLTGCAVLPGRLEAPPSFALADGARTALGKAAAQAAAGRAADESGFRLLVQPEDALQARLEMVADSERTLDLQYYVFRADDAGGPLLQALQQAAGRGVRVRLLVDDLYLDAAALAPFSAVPNVEVRAFNPLPVRRGGVVTRLLFSLHEFRRVNHRMHNKLLVADNSFSVSGGRNVAAEYFMQNAAANFLDLDVLAVGSVVREQSVDFDRYWNSAQAYPLAQLQAGALRQLASADDGSPEGDASLSMLKVNDADSVATPAPEVGALTWAPARVLADDPAKHKRATLKERFANSVSAQTLGLIESAAQRVVLITPYFIPGEVGLGIMARARDRGVHTIIVTNSLGATDEPLVHAAYARYRKRMLELGVTLYEISPTLSRRLPQFGNLGRSQGRLHAKVAMVDGRWMYIGSMNLDGRSASLNTESGLLIDSPELVGRFLAIAGPDRFSGAYQLRLSPRGTLQWLEDGGAIVHDREPGAGALSVLRSWLILPLLDEELL